jgi:hypothetical protein
MSWFRSSRGGVAWLAFFALACQLLLSFGHVHLGKFAGPVMWAAAEDGTALASAPAPQNAPTGLADEFCAICANIGLAGALVVPDSPMVVAPSASVQKPRWALAASQSASFDHLLFDARGPPHA